MDAADEVDPELARNQKAFAILSDLLNLPPEQREVQALSLTKNEPQLRELVAKLLESAHKASTFMPSESQLPPREPCGLGDLPLPRLVGNYMLQQQLGEGGMGRVYRARDLELERTVAIKVIRPELVSEGADFRLEREAMLLAHVVHSGIASIYRTGSADFGQGQQRYIAMEYVDGLSLEDYVGAENLGRKATVRLFMELCEAVERAHQKGVVHRDIKPLNVRVTREGKCKVLDFGLASIQHVGAGGGEAEEATFIAGTPEFMSPEQASGHIPDVRMDVYSLGATLMKILIGRGPVDVDGLSDQEALSKVKARVALPDIDLRALRDADLAAILRKALAAKTRERYKSTEGLADDLDRWIRGEAVRARSIGFMGRTLKFASRHRMGVGLSLLAFIVILSGTTTTLAFARTAVREETRSSRMLTFLKDMLRSSEDPRLDGVELSVTHLLGAGADKLLEAFPDEPDTRAELADTIGMAFFENGDYERGKRLITDALRWQTSGGDGDSSSSSLMRYHLGVIVKEIGRSQDAEGLLRDSYERFAHELGKDHSNTIRSHYWLGHVLMDLGRPAEAEVVFSDVLERRRDNGFGPGETLGPEESLALSWKAMGRMGDAEVALRRVLDAKRKFLGENAVELYDTIGNLAGCLGELGKFEAAEPLAQEALAGYIRLRGEEHPLAEAASLRLKVIRELMLPGRPAAEPPGKEPSEATAADPGELTERQCFGLLIEASSDVKCGRFEEAERKLDRVLRRLRELGGNRLLLLTGQNLRVLVLGATGREQTAIEDARRLIDLQTAGETTGFGLAETLMVSLATLLCKVGDGESAMETIVVAEKRLSESVGETSYQTLVARGARVSALVVQERYEEAVALGEQVLAAALEHLGGNQLAIMKVRFDYARALHAAGNREAARPELALVQQYWLEVCGPESPGYLGASELLRD